MTYPQLREMISNYTKTLTKKTCTAETTSASDPPPREVDEDRSDRRHHRRPKLHARPPAPITNAPPTNYTPQTTPIVTSVSTPTLQVPRDPPRPAPGPPQAFPATTPNAYGHSRRGQGPNPCFVCGAAGHSWIHCPRKVPGRGCAVCGSLAHRTNLCTQRYHPETQARWCLTPTAPLTAAPIEPVASTSGSSTPQ